MGTPIWSSAFPPTIWTSGVDGVSKRIGADGNAYLPYLLRKENIARIEGDVLLVGDRRVFPFERTSVACHSVAEAAAAIRSMVTQGGGPVQVALESMRFTARLMEKGKLPHAYETFADAVSLLGSSRPTNTTMRRTMQNMLEDIKQSYDDGTMSSIGVVRTIDALVDDQEALFNQKYERMSDLGCSLIMDGDRILTTCFAEHSFLLSVRKAREDGKSVQVFVSETRPYLQGARLTAPSLEEMGVPVTLITDGMCAHLMDEGSVTRYMTAADLVAFDGTVVNKTGTLQTAICAAWYGIPYHVFSLSPDVSKQNRSDIVMEEREGKDVCFALGQRTTTKTMHGRYPAFDIIPSRLVTSIITSDGVFDPSGIGERYRMLEKGDKE